MLQNKPRKKKPQSERFPWLFICPALLFLMVFSIVPILISGVASLTDLNFWGLMDFSKIKFIGFSNYFKLLSDAEFIQTLGNTLVFVIIGVPLVLVLSFTISLLLSRADSGLFGAYRVIYYLPSITNVVAIAVVFSYLFNSQFGLLNYLLSMVGIEKVMWLLEPIPAKLSVIMLAVWRGLGINIIIFLAAIKSIPTSLFEAARIDGAGKLRQVFAIIIPSVRFATFYVSMTSIIVWLQLFEESFVLTKGGPLGSTRSVVQFTYERGFTYNQYGYAAAASIVLFAIILTATIVQNMSRRLED